MKIKNILIGALVVVGGYQLYKFATKPKVGEKKSNATGKLQAGFLAVGRGDGKVYKLKADGFDTRWIRLSEEQQPKAMDWYTLNGTPYWVKWNGQFAKASGIKYI